MHARPHAQMDWKVENNDSMQWRYKNIDSTKPFKIKSFMFKQTAKKNHTKIQKTKDSDATNMEGIILLVNWLILICSQQVISYSSAEVTQF